MAADPWEVVNEQAVDPSSDPWAVTKEEPISVKAGRGLMEVPRQVGLAARYVVEGNAQVADLLAEPLRNLVINPIIKTFGGTPILSTTEVASNLATKAGLPSPENANERVVADASRLLAGAGGTMRAAGAVAPALTGVGQKVVGSLAQYPAAQAASAVGAGAAGGSVREAGGGPGAQFVASLAGGLVAPLALSAVAGPLQSAESLARRIFAPKDIEGTLKVELERIGMDWNALSRQAQTALVKDASKAIYSGQPINANALRRLADFRNINATPMIGSVTQDPTLVTAERNLAKQQANTSAPIGGPNLPSIQNENAQKVLTTLGSVADSPLDTIGTGQAVTEKVVATDNAMKAVENANYAAARDTGGRAIELDRSGFVNEAFDNLQKNNRGGWLPSQVRDLLNDISAGKAPFTVDTIDGLKTLLAQESRSSSNGNVRAAIASVRDALENMKPAPAHAATGSELPIPGAMGARLAQADTAAAEMSTESLAAFDRARAFARSRREWQESAPFIEDALSGVAPDKFVQKHLIGAPVADVEKVRRFVNNDPTLRDAVRKQLIEYIMARGGADADITKFSGDGMWRALNQLGQRKLAMFFDPKEIGQIRSAINVARYSQAQPIGSAVNNSNTAAMIWGRLSDILLKGSAAPVAGPLIAAPLRRVTLGMEGRAFADVPNVLVPAVQKPPMPFNALLLSAAGTNPGDQ